MKGKDLYYFIATIFLSLLAGYFIFNNFDMYSEMVTFLSIVIGFEITSFSILFSTPLKKTLYDRKIKTYKTELHRLKDFFQFSIYVGIISIILIFCIPKFSLSIQNFHLTKDILVMPILIGNIYCFIKLSIELFRIFTYPTNE